MRKRGWSITSTDQTIDSNRSRQNRTRSNTEHSELSLTADEKTEIMNSFPTEIIELDQEDQTEIIEIDQDEEDQGEREEEDHLEMFGDSDGDRDCHERPKKKQRSNENNKQGVSSVTSVNGIDPKLLELAKGRLSKWTTRLFDPNRPRGLVETPEMIPLNDEFLVQFGQTNKKMQSVTGQTVDVDRETLDEDIDDLVDKGDDKKKVETKSKAGYKVRRNGRNDRVMSFITS